MPPGTRGYTKAIVAAQTLAQKSEPNADGWGSAFGHLAMIT
jgi:hypothetical protein